MIIDETTRLGWIGLGVMGGAMAARLLNAGFSLTVFNRTKSKADAILDAGACWVNSPAEVAARSDIVFSMVGFPADVREIVFGDSGIFQAWQDSSCTKTDAPRKVYVDMTTSSPELAREIATRLAEVGITGLDAPVSGGDTGAKNGTLSIMIGGDEKTAADLMPLWQLLGKNIVWQGPAGTGQSTKISNQILIAGNMIGVCESLLYAAESGLDLEKMFTSVSTGAAGSWSLSNLAPRILAGNFQPGFVVEHFVKDMGIALEESRRMKLSLPGLALVQQLYLALEAQGGSRLGTQALIKALAALSNKAVPGI